MLAHMRCAGFEVYCIGGGAPASSPEAQACKDANLSGLHELLAQVSLSHHPRNPDQGRLPNRWLAVWAS